MNEELIRLKAEGLTLSGENKKPFDCGNIFSALGVIGMGILFVAMFK